MRKRRFLSGIVLGALVLAAVGASPSNEAVAKNEPAFDLHRYLAAGPAAPPRPAPDA